MPKFILAKTIYGLVRVPGMNSEMIIGAKGSDIVDINDGEYPIVKNNIWDQFGIIKTLK